MKTATVLNLDPDRFSEEARIIYRQMGHYVEKSMSRQEMLSKITDYDIIVLRYSHRIDREVISRANRLKIIATNLTGIDHIDVEAANQRGIKVVSLKGETEFLEDIHASAEHTWALLMALIRKIPAAHRSVVSGTWDRDSFQGNELNGKRLGVVGMGRNGRKVAGYGMAFGMHVSGFDEALPDFPEGVTQSRSLDDLLEHSDVVTLHVPLNDRTHHLMNRDRFHLIPASTLLVNTSRGDIVDETALLEALKTGRIGGAALDVLTGELSDSISATHPLIAYAAEAANLIITPHIGGVTRESWEKTECHVARRVRNTFLEMVK